MKHHTHFWVKRAIIPTILGLMLCMLPFLNTQQADAVRDSQERLVSIYDGVTTQTVVTTASTVQEVLARTNISLGQYDSVEPGVTSALASNDYKINIYRARPVIVIDGGVRKAIMSPYQSLHDIAKSIGITTYPEDKLTVSRVDNFVDEGIGLKLQIEHSTPVTLVIYGQKYAIRTRAQTVQQLLKEKNIDTTTGVRVWPDAATPIQANQTIAVFKDGDQNLVEEPVPFRVERVQDATKDVGYRSIKEHGVTGRRLVVYVTEVQNGKNVRKELQSITLAEPQNQIEVVGSKRAGFNGSFDEALTLLRSCEGSYVSINNRASNPDNWYYGAYQFNLKTWSAYAPDGYKSVLPTQAPPAAQDQAAYNLYLKRGWQPWPACARSLQLQDVYR